MEKLLIITNPWDSAQCGGFSLFDLLDIPRGGSSVFLNGNGQVEERQADIIILPDENIFLGDDYRDARELLQRLKEAQVTLFIVFHQNGDFLRAYNDPNTNGNIKDYLQDQLAIVQSHVPGGFYWQELKNIANAIKQKNRQAYDIAIEEAKEKFPDSLLEAKLELLHMCLTPEGRDKGTWDENGQITILRDGEEPFRGAIPDNIGKAEFKKLKQKTGGAFGEEYMNALADLRNALLPEHEYAN